LRFCFADNKLQKLYTEERGAHKYPEGVVDAFLDLQCGEPRAMGENREELVWFALALLGLQWYSGDDSVIR